MLILFVDQDPGICNELIINEKHIQLEVKKLFSGSRLFHLDDLFDIRYGLLEQRYRDEVDGFEGEKVMFIRPSMISENDNTLLNPADTLENPVFFDRKPRIEEGGRSKDISADERLPFSTKHLLKQTDLLLKSKGESGFVDLSKGFWNPSHRYVASHHFIVLSVKSNILEHLGIEFSYVTGILRFVLEVELKKRYSSMKYENEMKMKELANFNILKQNTVDDKNKIDKKLGFGFSKRSFFSMQPALSIEELKSKQIAVPVNKESQWAIIDKFYRLEDLKRRVEATMIIWEQNFSNVNKGEL